MTQSSTHQVKSFGELIDVSIKLYEKKITTILGLSVVSALAYFILGLGSHAAPGTMPKFTWTWFILFVLYIIVTALVTIALYALADGRKEDALGLLNLALVKLKSVFAVGLLEALIVIGGFVLFLVPGVIFAIWYTFAVPIVLFENKHGMDALHRSREYVRGRWWTIFGRLFLLGLAAILVSAALGIVVAVLKAIIGEPAQSLSQLFSIFVITPIATIFSYQLYRSASTTKVPE